MFFVFQIIAFELVAVNYPYYYENTRHWQSTCEVKSLAHLKVWGVM